MNLYHRKRFKRKTDNKGIIPIVFKGVPGKDLIASTVQGGSIVVEEGTVDIHRSCNT